MTNFLIAALIAAATVFVGYGMIATGPNCPGMPETYLGWCE